MSEAPTIIPAILATTADELLRQAELVAPLSTLLHYDVGDGQFVSTRTPKPDQYPRFGDHHRIIWHLMVEEPLKFLDQCLDYPTERIVLHVEARGSETALARLTERQIPVGLALNPSTHVADVGPLLSKVRTVQVMTVEPGAQGHAFQPDLLSKLTQLRERRPDLTLGVDGGVNAGTIEVVARYHPNEVVVGSALTQSEDPADTYRTVTRLASLSSS